ncbi:MAG: biotin synthase BioB [Armatimonadota bacterium]
MPARSAKMLEVTYVAAARQKQYNLLMDNATMHLNDILRLYDVPLAQLAAQADKARRDHIGQKIDLCTICNAKSGLCSENCKFCAQSAHYATDAPTYPLMSKDDMIDCAKRAQEIGSGRFGIVTSGRGLSQDEIKCVADTCTTIRQDIGIEVCASLGCLEYEQLVMLKNSGVSRYHHNIETSRNFFPNIATTHGFEDRLSTIDNASKAGLSVCSGGIIGMGESREDRASMALTLKELSVDSVPINILMPIPGTPLADSQPISVSEALKTIAIFRLVMPSKTIKLAAGRESFLKDFQGAAFMAGANGMLIGGYLTQRGRPEEEDRKLVEEILQAWSI